MQLCDFFELQVAILKALYHSFNPQNAANYPQIGTRRNVVQLLEKTHIRTTPRAVQALLVHRKCNGPYSAILAARYHFS